MFSHYPYYDEIIKKLLAEDVVSHERESWVRLMGKFVRYPFQNNFSLPAERGSPRLHPWPDRGERERRETQQLRRLDQDGLRRRDRKVFPHTV